MLTIERDVVNRACGQRGYAMLALIAALGIATTAVVVTSLSSTAVRNEQGRKTSAALALAKQALIASAASNELHPGALPCPDVTGPDNVPDGISDPVIGACTAMIGRLPWQTLGLPELRDADAEQLWYALSTNFQDSSQINSRTAGDLTLTGTINATAVVAIVFSAGMALNNGDSRQRTPANINNPAAYLESYDSGNPLQFTTCAPDNLHKCPDGSLYNDQLAVISAIDVFALVQRRVAMEIQKALKAYYSSHGNKLPWPAQTCPTSTACTVMASPVPPPVQSVSTGYLPVTDLTLPAWFVANNWNLILGTDGANGYYVDSDCAAGTTALTDDGRTSQCGSAFARVSFGTDGVFLGATGGFPNAGTTTVLTFSGINAGYANHEASTLKAAVLLAQLQ
ncbi:MAG: hypothetical protein JWN94_4796 [Betaproteobacteria bacterium]|nr:hypothetical protein [Betaproteobacteria bacterium]